MDSLPARPEEEDACWNSSRRRNRMCSAGMISLGSYRICVGERDGLGRGGQNVLEGT